VLGEEKEKKGRGKRTIASSLATEEKGEKKK